MDSGQRATISLMALILTEGQGRKNERTELKILIRGNKLKGKEKAESLTRPSSPLLNSYL